jgi:hypothetical protein
MSAEYTTGDSMVVLTAPPATKGRADRFTGDVWVDGIPREGRTRLRPVGEGAVLLGRPERRGMPMPMASPCT